MSIKHSILAVLQLGPCHGYQLRHELLTRTGGAIDVNIGQIYSTLDRLERDGLIEPAAGNKAKNNRPDAGQRSYALTKAGASEAATWLAQPEVDAGDLRHDLATKLALAVTLPGVKASELLRVQQNATLQRLQQLTKLKRTQTAANGAELTEQLLNERAIFQLEAESRWLEHIAVLLATAKASGLDPNFDLSNYQPKRGRPAKTASGAKND